MADRLPSASLATRSSKVTKLSATVQARVTAIQHTSVSRLTPPGGGCLQEACSRPSEDKHLAGLQLQRTISKIQTQHRRRLGDAHGGRQVSRNQRSMTVSRVYNAPTARIIKELQEHVALAGGGTAGGGRRPKSLQALSVPVWGGSGSGGGGTQRNERSYGQESKLNMRRVLCKDFSPRPGL
ncbi:hypothetical protein E2C01_047508 [Portunus trituberculatus]|uniref:Uncharacterized protein n=1 Tax=Portunus trituberculatus TaxID=210409 RepID=A0A5B7G7R5_PORTR|nr:hypothetical protein [Portunus trituberculatus]